MALAFLDVKVGTRGKAAAHAEYIAREGRHARLLAVVPGGGAAAHAEYVARAGRHADRLKGGEWLEGTGHGNLPSWSADDPRTFWRASDDYERANGTPYREIVLGLPRELSVEQRRALVASFVEMEMGDAHPYQWAVHNKIAADGRENPHCHLQFSERRLDGIERATPKHFFRRAAARYRDPRTGEMKEKDPASGGARKGWGDTVNRVAYLEDLRARWANLVNQELERAQRPERIDMRSRAARGLPGAPEKKMGPLAANDPEVQALTRAYRSLRGVAEDRQASARAERERSGARAIELKPSKGFSPTLRSRLGDIYGFDPKQGSWGQPIGSGRQPPQRPKGVPARVRVSWLGGDSVRLESTDGGVVIDHGDRMVGVHGTADEAEIMACIAAGRRWRQMEAQAEDEVARQRVRKALREVGAELATPRPAVAQPTAAPTPSPAPRPPDQVSNPMPTVLMQTRREDERAAWRQRYRARLLREVYGDRISPDDAWLKAVAWINNARSQHAGHGEACVIRTHRGSRLVDTGGEILAGGEDARDLAVSLVRMAQLKGWSEVEIGEGAADLRARVMAELRPLAERAGLKVFDPGAEQVRSSAMDALPGRAQQGLDAVRDAAESERRDEEQEQKPRVPRGPGMGR